MRFFNQISSTTPESVDLDFTLAGVGSRVYALILDYSILLLVFLAFWIVWGIFTYGFLSSLGDSGQDYSAAPTWLLAIFILLNFVIWNGYFVLFETLWQGQTPGKRLAKIRVIRDDGRTIALPQSVLRSLLRAIDETLFIGLLFILFGKREKRIGDWVAGTLVIQEERGDRKNQLIISDQGKILAAKLPDIANLTTLIPDDYAVIQEYLQRRGRMATQARTAKSMELAQQLRTLINLETIPTGTTSDHFLEAVYVAYQQMTGTE